jgi:formamidopyrimidine-DNA glycosylase
MIELPEAAVIAGQITAAIKGKRIASAVRGNSPHKFAFYTGSASEYARTLKGQKVGSARSDGWLILVNIGRSHLLVLGGGGERIHFHEDEATLPKKHQLLLSFDDGTAFTVTVQGWGSIELMLRSEYPTRATCAKPGVSPLSDEFTFGHFEDLVASLPEGDSRSVKFFLVSEPGVTGLGNGCLQDVLFKARIHPRRRVVDMTKRERRRLHGAVRSVLTKIVDRGGRDSELDLHGVAGRYRRVLHSKVVGEPCPMCGTSIEKIQYLGGACYFCPSCQT